MLIFNAIWSGYIMGNAVERGGNFILDQVGKRTCERRRKLITEEFASPAKVGLYWLGVTIILATVSVVPAPASCVLGVLGATPFVKPLISNFATFVSNSYKNLSLCQKIRCIAATAAFSTAQYRLMHAIGPMSSSAHNAICLAFSNLALGASLLVTGAILHKRKVENARSSSPRNQNLYSLDKATFISKIIRERQLVEGKIKNVKAKLLQIKNFIKDNEELKQLCLTAFEKDKQNIVPVGNICNVDLDPNDEIDAMTNAKFKLLSLEHELNEFKIFIQRNSDVLASFTKHVLDLNENSGTDIQENALTPYQAPTTTS